MYEYAMKKEYVEKDYSKFIIKVSSRESANMHKAFANDEVKKLWEDGSDDAKKVLLYIYTGFRATELLNMKNKDVNIKDKCFIGGMKTNAGKNRVVPIHNKILSIVKELYSDKNEYLFSEDGKPISYNHFKDYHFRPTLERLGIKHTMHDTRHTCASLLKEFGCDDFYRKLILGHHIEDLTDRVYTHVEVQRLLLEVNKIGI